MSSLASRRAAFPRGTPWLRSFTTFEKVIIANSAVILLGTLAGWWITQHNPETYHYLIDTGFIAFVALAGLTINFVLLRAAFAPLRGVLATMRAVERGDLTARAEAYPNDADAAALARGFNAMLDRLEAARHEMAARVLQAQEEERRRVALELHDQTGQSLTALTLHAEAIAQGLSAAQSPEARERARLQAERLSALAQRTLAEVQALSRQLRPPMLDDLGLAAALRWLGEDASERLGVAVRVRLRSQEDERLPGEVETALFRIAQEAVTNAVRHGRARTVWIALRRLDGAVALTVADDGGGFAAQMAPSYSSMGLEGMRERARLLHGMLVLRSAPGRGCVMRARVPLFTQDVAQSSHASEGQTHAATQV